MVEDCLDLGFSLEEGHEFFKKYGNETNKLDKLKEIIDEVSDVKLLGSVIFLNWRYFNHWAYDQKEILEEENINWFILALRRLKDLAEKNIYLFQGEVKEFILRSDAMVFGPFPDEGQVISQDIYLNIEGRVSIKSYKFTRQVGIKNNFERSDFKIRKQEAYRIFYEIKKYFGNKYNPFKFTVLDAGRWDAKIVNTEGKIYYFCGSLFSEVEEDLHYLSIFIRGLLGREDLFVLDGKAKIDRIKKITLDYERRIKNPLNSIHNNIEFFKAIHGYKENLIIDREEDTIEYRKEMGEGYKISQKFEVEALIDAILENFEEDKLFSKVNGNPPDTIANTNEIRKYKITIDYEKKAQKIIEGDFDKESLPEDFPEFAETLSEYLNFFNFEEILNPRFYKKVRRLKDQYIYCSLSFGNGKKTYYYRTEDDNIEEGDLVVVPVGIDNHEAEALVVKVEYFNKEDLPFPLEKTKFIIEKYN